MSEQKKALPVSVHERSKDCDLKPHREDPTGAYLTTDQGVRVTTADDSLKAGVRGPTFIEDFHLRERITRFDHERIPERVVHARGSAAHGYFQLYESLSDLTRAKFLNDPSVKTPVFVRFSTVGGARGSADTVRDVRGFATKFYTEEGIFDLVGNNIPVFFVQDGMKFPDVVHAVKPEPNNEIPQASSAHDSFWDFVSLVPETMHMVMWLLSDRAIPRSFRMMEGFGVHTFRLINREGRARFVKFHWKPLLGVHSLVWDEAQKLAGKDPDYHRRDLWDAIEMGDDPEYELGLQVISEEDAQGLSFDLLDPTKLVPEELFPVRRVGKLTLNRNPHNFFAETEQVAFCPANLVPGIDVTNDPLLQARLFSYLDTQLTRHLEKLEGHKVAQRSESFKDHYTQAILFWNSLSLPERKHLIRAARFELSKIADEQIRKRVVEHLSRVNADLGRAVGATVGVAAPVPDNKNAPNATVACGGHAVDRSEALSIDRTVKRTIKSRRVAILAWSGFKSAAVADVRAALEASGAHADVVAAALGTIKSAEDGEVKVDKTLISTESIAYDAVFIAGGRGPAGSPKMVEFVAEAFRHAKPIGAVGDGMDLLLSAGLKRVALADAKADAQIVVDKGVVIARSAAVYSALSERFIQAIAQHRHWEREDIE